MPYKLFGLRQSIEKLSNDRNVYHANLREAGFGEFVGKTCVGLTTQFMIAFLCNDLLRFDEKLLAAFELELDKAPPEMNIREFIKRIVSCQARLTMSPLRFKPKGFYRSLTITTGIYNRENLIDYFSTLERQLEACAFDKPVAIMLLNAMHANGIGYDPVQSHWYYFDTVNYVRCITNISTLVDNIMRDLTEKNQFSSSDEVALAARFYTTRSAGEKLNNALSNWQRSNWYESQHQPTKSKAEKLDVHGVPWVYMSALNGQYELTRLILENSCFHINVVLSKVGQATMLHMSAVNKDFRMAKLLLLFGADQNLGQSLAIAAQYNALSIARTILEKGSVNVDVAVTVTEGGHGSPLAVAADRGNLDMCRLLIRHGANIHRQIWISSGVYTPLELASISKRYQVVGFFNSCSKDHKERLDQQELCDLALLGALN